MTPQEFTSRTVQKILAQNRTGLTYPELLRKMLRATDKSSIPLYLGPSITLRDFLQQLAEQGLLTFSTTGSGRTQVTPTGSLTLESVRRRTARSA